MLFLIPHSMSDVIPFLNISDKKPELTVIYVVVYFLLIIVIIFIVVLAWKITKEKVIS